MRKRPKTTSMIKHQLEKRERERERERESDSLRDRENDYPSLKKTKHDL